MSLVPEPEGNSLSDCHLTSEVLELEGGRLFVALLHCNPLNCNRRVSERCLTDAGFNVERILA